MSNKRALLDRRQLLEAVGVVSCLLFVKTRLVSAQATSTVQGTLTDPASASVPGATVTATKRNRRLASRSDDIVFTGTFG